MEKAERRQVSHPRVLRLFAYADDPQIYLPLITNVDDADPLVLSIWMRFDASAETIDNVVGDWNRGRSSARTKLHVMANDDAPAERVQFS